MDTRLTLLGLLGAGPGYGYDLKTNWDHWFARTKPLAFGQVYSTLARLLRDGLIVQLGAEAGAGPAGREATGRTAGAGEAGAVASPGRSASEPEVCADRAAVCGGASSLFEPPVAEQELAITRASAARTLMIVVTG